MAFLDKVIDDKNISITLSDNITEVSQNSSINIFETQIINKTTALTWAIELELKENIIAWNLYNLISNDEKVVVNGDFTYNWDKMELLPNAKWIKEIKLIWENKIQIHLK